MNLVDLLLLIIVAAAAFEGFRRGLLRQVLELGGIVLALFLAYRYGAAAGENIAGLFNIGQYLEAIEVPFVDMSGMIESAADLFNRALGCLLVFLAVVGITRLLAVALGSVAKMPVVGTVNKTGGLILGLVKGLLMCIVLVWVANLMPIAAVEDALGGSGISKLLLNIVEALFPKLQDALGV